MAIVRDNTYHLRPWPRGLPLPVQSLIRQLFLASLLEPHAAGGNDGPETHRTHVELAGTSPLCSEQTEMVKEGEKDHDDVTEIK